MPGKPKGLPKTGGRQPGSTNKTTAEAKELLQKILYNEFDNITDSLKNLRAENDSKYIDALSKLITYVLPKKTDLTSDNQKINLEPITGMKIIKDE